MATIAPHADSSASAFLRAGQAMLRRTANATAITAGGYEFGVFRRDAHTAPDLSGAPAHSAAVMVDAWHEDVAAAPVAIVEEAVLHIDGCAFRVVDRVDHASLGQVTLQLEPAR